MALRTNATNDGVLHPAGMRKTEPGSMFWNGWPDMARHP